MITTAIGLLLLLLRNDVRPLMGIRKEDLRGSVRVAIVIGTILILINYGLPVPPWARMALTVCVPFCVSLHGRLMARKHATP